MINKTNIPPITPTITGVLNRPLELFPLEPINKVYYLFCFILLKVHNT